MAHSCHDKTIGSELSDLIPTELGMKLALYQFKVGMVFEHTQHWGEELKRLATYTPIDGPTPWATPTGEVHSCVHNLVRMLDRSDYRMFPEEMMQFIKVIRWLFDSPCDEIQAIADKHNMDIDVSQEFSMDEVKLLIVWVERQCPGAGRALL